MRGLCCALLGCGEIKSPDEYARLRAEAECGVSERCDLGFFEAEYSGIEDCADDRAEQLEAEIEALDESADCTYDPREAARCVAKIRGLTCENAWDGDDYAYCDFVFHDCEGGYYYYNFSRVTQ